MGMIKDILISIMEWEGCSLEEAEEKLAEMLAYKTNFDEPMEDVLEEEDDD